MKHMADVSQKIMKAWTDSKMTDTQKSAAINKLKADGAKWYKDNCGAKSKEEDEVANLFEEDSELAYKRKRRTSGNAAKRARMMRRRKAAAARRRRYDEDDMLEEDSELLTKGQCVSSAKSLMKKIIQTGFSTKLSIDQKKAILKKLKS
jgi:hypothetical protein